MPAVQQPAPGVGPGNNQQQQQQEEGGLAGLFMAYAMQLQQAMQQQQAAAGGAGPSPGAQVVVRGLGFHPPGAEHPLLEGASFTLRPNQLGLLIGRSGSGKTTLLQLLAGLSEQTAGQIFIHRPLPGDHASGLLLPTHIEQRMQQVCGVDCCVRSLGVCVWGGGGAGCSTASTASGSTGHRRVMGMGEV
jgi:hypothetical protein